MSDLERTHPYKYVQDISVLRGSRKVLGALSRSVTHALTLSKLPPGAAIIGNEDENQLIVHFCKAADCETFTRNLSALDLNDFISSPCTKQRVEFNPENYNIVWTVGVYPSIDPHGDINHLIEVCKKAGYQDFRVIYEKDKEDINVYLPRGQSPAFFYAVNEQLTEEKRRTNIEISTLRKPTAPGTHLRIVE